MKNTTRELAEWAESVTIESMPSSVIDRVGYLLLDLLGVSIYGLKLESSILARRYAERWGEKGQSTILGSSFRTHPATAALVNGITGHGPELDDVTEESSLHPGVVNLTALLSVSEARESGGWNARRFIEASAVAYEITIRIGNAVNISRHYARGFHPTATAGVFGAAAGVAKYLDLDAGSIQNAMGIAGSQAAGSLAYLQNGAWTKRFNAGWAAHAGITAALLAESGMTGPEDILTGREGFFQAYTEKPNLARLTDRISKDWAIEEVALKPYGCCRYSHSAIDAALALRTQGIQAKDIRQANIFVPKPGLLLVGEPQESKRGPKSTVDAQFSAHYAFLVALSKGHAEPDDFLNPEKFLAGHPEVNHITLSSSSECDSIFPKHWSTRVALETNNGKHVEQFIMDPKGSPHNPLSWAELTGRFRHLARSISGESQEQLIHEVGNLRKTKIHPYLLLKKELSS